MSDALRQWLQYAPPAPPLQPGKRWNVFLSYRSVNRPWVINLFDVLRGHGHEVFLDQVVLAGGDRLIRKLQEGLEQSQAGVLVWSSASADSEWVEREYEVMESKAGAGFRFVPVRLDDRELPVFARLRIFLDFSQYPDGPNGGELLRLLHAVAGLPLSEAAARFAAEQDEAGKVFAAQVRAAVKNGDATELRTLFDTGGAVWETSSALGCAVAEGLTKLKEPDAALDVVAVLQKRFPRAIRPKQLRALALARRGKEGDLQQAQAILATLYELGQKDPETIGIYARTWMDRYAISGDVLDLRQSRDLYVEAFEAATDDYYTGVNAAAKSVLLANPADLERARELTARVQKIVGTEPVPKDYWKTATVAEMHLILGDYAKAGAVYSAAVAMASKEYGSHESTWLQACRLMAVLAPAAADRQQIRQAFKHLPDCAPA